VQFIVHVWCSLASTAAIGLIAFTLYGCSNDPMERYYQAQREAQQKASAEEEVEKKERQYTTPLEFSQIKSAVHKDIPIALVEPIIVLPRCEGDPILVSLPDEIACERGSHWIYQPSQNILPPADLLLVSLRFTGLSVSSHPSLAEAKQAGAKAAILTVITQADATVKRLRDFYKERHIDADDPSNDALSRVIGTVKMHATVVRLDSGQILWKGPVQQVMERTVPSLPLAEGRALIEAAAGTGRFETQAYGVRSVVVQAYTQVARTLATHVDESLKGMIQ
jgi:hypothetical protein